MKQTNENANVVNNSNNLQTVEVTDATTTKGKVTAKFNLVESANAEEAIEKVDKNQLFSVELKDYFCPVRFDSSVLESSLKPLVENGILSEEAKQKAIDTAKREFLEANAEVIAKGQKLTFAQVLAKLQENKTLYNKVLQACKVSELKEEFYIENGKVAIFRANQCTDKDGNNRYTEVTLKANENGIEFFAPLFVEYRDVTTDNILLAIRYYNSKLEAQKSIVNQLAEYRRILSNVETYVTKAKENNFTKEQILQIVAKVFA